MNSIKKFILLIVTGPLFILDFLLAKARRAVRRVSLQILERFLPTEQVQDLVMGQSVAKMVARLVGEYSTSVIDIGARWGATGIWWRISPISKLIGFDPDPKECAELNSRVNNSSKEKYIPMALGAEKKSVELYLTRQPACSSIFQPDPNLYSRYPVLKEIEPLQKCSIEVQPLDSWWKDSGSPEISFVKIDTQGYELEILKGAVETLKGCIGVEVEVEFSPLYLNQPLFHEVDAFLRKNGFVIWTLDSLCKYQEHDGATVVTERIKNFHLKKNLAGAGGRLFWGNAIYFKDYYQISIQPENQRLFFIYASFFDALGDFSASSQCLQKGMECNPKALNDLEKKELEQKYKQLRGGVSEAFSPPLSWYPQLTFQSNS